MSSPDRFLSFCRFHDHIIGSSTIESKTYLKGNKKAEGIIYLKPLRFLSSRVSTSTQLDTFQQLEHRLGSRHELA